MNTITETSIESEQLQEADTQSQPPSLFKSTLWLLALLFLAQFVLGFAFVVVYGIKQGSDFNKEAFNIWFSSMPVLLTLTLVSSLLTFYILIKATNKDSWVERFDFWAVRKPEGKSLAKWLAVIFVFWLISLFIGEWFKLPEEQFMLDLKDAGNSSFMVLALIVVGLCFVGPIIEELIFRGWLFSKITQTKLGNIGALLLTSVIFTVIHAQYEQSITFLMIFTLGLLLAFVRYKSNNISYAIAMHVVFNSVSMFALFLL